MKKFEFSPSIVVSVLALFVALSGGAYAALGPHSVGAPQLKAGAVTTRAIRDNSIVQSKIRAGAVGSREIRAGSISATKVSGTLPGTLVAYAKITENGVVTSDSWRIHNKNVLQLPQASYCLFDLPKHRTAMVSPGFDGSGTVIANLTQTLPPEGTCGLVNDDAIEVSTSFSVGNEPTKWKYEPFYIYLFS